MTVGFGSVRLDLWRIAAAGLGIGRSSAGSFARLAASDEADHEDDDEHLGDVVSAGQFHDDISQGDTP